MYGQQGAQNSSSAQGLSPAPSSELGLVAGGASPWASSPREPPRDPGPAATAFAPAAEQGPGSFSLSQKRLEAWALKFQSRLVWGELETDQGSCFRAWEERV